MGSSEKIIILFSYKNDERKLFKTVDKYMVVIEKWLKENEFSDDQLFRFMIVGLYLEYRATNHQGGSFHTRINEWYKIDDRPETKEKLLIFNSFYKKEINSTEEYLSLLKKKGLHRELQGIDLAQFVLSGKEIN